MSRPAGASVPVDPATARLWRFAALLLRPATLAAAGLAFGALLPLSVLTSGVPFCPFKLATGLPCPGCGITRAAVAFLHGDVATSFYYHPLGAPLVIAVVVLGLLDLWYWWRAGRGAAPSRPASWLVERVMATPAPWIAIGALAVVWLIRLPLYLVGSWVF